MANQHEEGRKAQERREIMKNIASRFSTDARLALKRELDIDLSDEKDYSGDELENLYNRIADDFPYSYDDIVFRP